MINIESKIDEILRRVTRINRDTEQIKLFSGNYLGNDRAIALLASGSRLYVDPRDRGCGINLLSEGKYEEEEIRIFRRFLKPGITILDIGANYGYYTIVSAPYIRPGGKVHSFEPNPHIHELLSSSIFLNGYTDVATAHRSGVFDSEATLDFLIDPKGPGGARIVDAGTECPPGLDMIQVPVSPIDTIIAPDVTVDLVKIDVEGREWNVLRGMRETIKRSPNIKILMELFYSFFGNDEKFRSFISFIQDDLGLMIYKSEDGGRLIKVGASDLVGRESYVVLSAAEIPGLPDLTIYPAQLNKSVDAECKDGVLVWNGARAGMNIIAHGPYVYLPKGGYKVVVNGDFTGNFQFALQESFGDRLFESRSLGGSGVTFDIPVMFDAPHMEVAFWGAGGAQCRIESIEFWRQ